MSENAHKYKLDALKYCRAPPLDAFMRAGPRGKNEDYCINPIPLDMLHTKKIAGNHDSEEPYAHLDFFEEICGTFKLNAYTEEEMRLKLFGQTLSNKALNWFKACPAGTIDTLKKLSAAFLVRFYPERKSYGARHMITNFKNQPGESLIKGYIRF